MAISSKTLASLPATRAPAATSASSLRSEIACLVNIAPPAPVSACSVKMEDKTSSKCRRGLARTKNARSALRADSAWAGWS